MPFNEQYRINKNLMEDRSEWNQVEDAEQEYDLTDYDKEKKEIISEYSTGDGKERSLDTLALHLNVIGKIPLLTEAEEIELGNRIKQGDKDALEDLVVANLRLVVSVAKKYVQSKTQFQDLIQEGTIGLIKAAEKFDCKKGRFCGYAVWYIRQEIETFCSKQIGISTKKARLIQHLRRFQSDFELKNNRFPTRTETSMEMKLSEKKVAKLETLMLTKDPISIDQPMCENDESGLKNEIPDQSGVDPADDIVNKEELGKLEKALSLLSEKEAFVVRKNFGLDDGVIRSLKETAVMLHISSEWARKIRDRALKKMAVFMEQQ